MFTVEEDFGEDTVTPKHIPHAQRPGCREAGKGASPGSRLQPHGSRGSVVPRDLQEAARVAQEGRGDLSQGQEGLPPEAACSDCTTAFGTLEMLQRGLAAGFPTLTSFGVKQRLQDLKTQERKSHLGDEVHQVTVKNVSCLRGTLEP